MNSEFAIDQKAISEGLCQICQSIDFDELFNLPAAECHDRCFADALQRSQYDLGSLADLQKRSRECVVCKFMFEAYTTSTGETPEAHATVKLQLKRWLSTNEINRKGWQDRIGARLGGQGASLIFLTALGRGRFSGCMVAFNPLPGSRYNLARTFRAFTAEEIQDRTANLDIVRGWLHRCKECHLDTGCEGGSGAEDWELTGLLLIDVDDNNNIVIADKRLPYVALSYVWSQAGSRPPRQQWEPALPRDLPKTIADAILVTRDLGKQYIWIDAYCINQDNKAEKAKMVSKMNLIYEQAAFTICAASPYEAEAGLYGVSQPIDRENQIVQMTPIGLFATVQIPKTTDSLEQTRWNTRGWTFQEAVLSRRCLLFMETGVAMWCRAELFHEIFDYPASSTGKKEGATYALDTHLPFSFTLGGKWDFGNWARIMQAYSSRGLSFPEDALGAISGVLNPYSRTSETAFVAGLPLKHIGSLYWKAQGRNLYKRRPMFPSWSWLGWDTSILYDHWVFAEASLPCNTFLRLPKIGWTLYGLNIDSKMGDIALQPIHVTVKYEATILTEFAAFEDVSLLKQLKIKTESVSLRIMRLDRAGNSESSQVWKLLDANGAKVPVIGQHGFHKKTELHTIMEHIVLPDNVIQGEALLPGGGFYLEFLCIQHWTETWSYPLRHGSYNDVVTSIAVVRNEQDGGATRIGAVAMPYKQWQAAGPTEVVVTLI